MTEPLHMKPDGSAWTTRKGDTPAEMWLGRRGIVDAGPFVPQVVGGKTWGRAGGAESGFSLNHAATRVGREAPTVADDGAVELVVGHTCHRMLERPEGVRWDIRFADAITEADLAFRLWTSPDVTVTEQPALTPEEIDEGIVRPDWCVGSIVLYAAASGNLVNSRGEAVETRKTGKVAHITSALVIAGDGDARRFPLMVDGDTVRIVPDWAWLERAARPVLVDPTFGLASVGGSSGTLWGTRTYSSSATLSENGTLSSLHAYASSIATSTNDWIRIGLYDDSTGPNNLINATSAILVLNTGGAVEFSQSGFSDALTSGTLWLAICSSDSAGTGASGANLATAYYDTTAGTSWYNAMDDPPMQDPHDRDASLTRCYSVWATYTTGGAAAGQPARKRLASIVHSPFTRGLW